MNLQITTKTKTHNTVTGIVTVMGKTFEWTAKGNKTAHILNLKSEKKFAGFEIQNGEIICSVCAPKNKIELEAVFDSIEQLTKHVHKEM